jgi:RNA polymerase sigma-70 factor, ECF subfamily
VDLTDEALLQKFRQTRDSQTFKSLVRRYQTRIYNAAFRILGSAEEAEDVVQDTCIKIHQGIDQFNKSSSFAAWIFRIAHNSCLDILRMRQRKNATFAFDPVSVKEDDGFDGGSLVTQAADPGPTPEEHLTMSEQVEFIAEKLGMLPETQRTVLLLHDIEGFSYQEISEIVGANIGTVRSRLHYGRIKMKELLEPYYSTQTVSPAPR